eukprot:scaffold9085_cov215-Amphora_coffeaeformis.AAC.7
MQKTRPYSYHTVPYKQTTKQPTDKQKESSSSSSSSSCCGFAILWCSTTNGSNSINSMVVRMADDDNNNNNNHHNIQTPRRLEDAGLIVNSASSTKQLVFQALPFFLLTAAAFVYVMYMKHCHRARIAANDGETVGSLEKEEEEDDDQNDMEMTSRPSPTRVLPR